MSKAPLKSGEKILFGIFGVFFLLALIGYIVLEAVRLNSEEPLFEQTTFFDFSPEGKIGNGIYQKANCNACHRALRSGTSMGLSLDGIGSKRSVEWLEEFLINPQELYEGQTIDHGDPPKEASYIARMSKHDRKMLAIFLSELRAEAGSSVAKVPPPERSEFIDNMVEVWAPEEWKEKYTDIREKNKAESSVVEGGDE